MNKILIVEDQADIRRLLEMVFSTKGWQTWGAESGEKGLEISRRVIPDVILLDVMLPGAVDGYAVARALREDPATATCSIIIMTAKVQEQDKMDAFEAGADDYIGKPFDLGVLQKKVERFLK